MCGPVETMGSAVGCAGGEVMPAVGEAEAVAVAKQEGCPQLSLQGIGIGDIPLMLRKMGCNILGDGTVVVGHVGIAGTHGEREGGEARQEVEPPLLKGVVGMYPERETQDVG